MEQTKKPPHGPRRRRVGRVVGVCVGLLALLSLFLWQNARRTAQTLAETQFFAMDTFMQLALPPEHQALLEDGKAEVYRIDALCSRFGQGELARFNAEGAGAVTLSSELYDLLSRAMDAQTETKNTFNPLLAPLMDLWGFGASQDEWNDAEYASEAEPPSAPENIPESAAIDALLPLTTPENLLFGADGVTVTKRDGVAADLGGSAKGYATDRVLAIWRAQGVSSGLMSLGGNVAVLGRRPDGEPWRVGVRDPLNAQGLLGVLSVSDVCVVTSGDYERSVERGGASFGHILDPRTGTPAQSGLLSVTVMCENAERADILSTALFVMGLNDAVEFWCENQDFEMILITEDRRAHSTPGLSKVFTLDAKGGYTLAPIA